jgi:Rieske Fe-S protein
VDPEGHDEAPHEELPAPTLWPVGFAIGVTVLLVGIVVSPVIAAVGGALTALFALLWVRDLTRSRRRPVPVDAETGEPDYDHVPQPLEPESFPRSKFLEGATLGIGAIIGGVVAVPALGFAIIPAFNHQDHPDIDLGPMSNFPNGKFIIATFMEDPRQGEVSRHTTYIRNNGLLGKVPSFTVLSNRCAHLGCPVQSNGLLFEKQAKAVKTSTGTVNLIPTLPAGFGCPCHGGQYDTEGNRTAGPPVRALDRYEFSIKNGNLFLGKAYSVAKVVGEGANAKIAAYDLTGPGQHVDGPEAWLYPIQPPGAS